jgi:formate-dependent nitrite reductase membrane component NrfD
MNKQKLKSLTYKYFWQQKFKEVGLFFGIPILSIGVLYLFSYFGRWVENLWGDSFSISSNITFWQHIGYGGLGILYFALISFFIILIIGVFLKWIDSNWEKANKRAMEELKK